MLRATARIAGGIGLVLIGIVGLILPIMPGWVFIIPGLVLLSEYFPPIKRLLDWAKAKVEKHDPRRSRKKPGPPSDASDGHAKMG